MTKCVSIQHIVLLDLILSRKGTKELSGSQTGSKALYYADFLSKAGILHSVVYKFSIVIQCTNALLLGKLSVSSLTSDQFHFWKMF